MSFELNNHVLTTTIAAPTAIHLIRFKNIEEILIKGNLNFYRKSKGLKI
jgi:hypothetical protein